MLRQWLDKGRFPPKILTEFFLPKRQGQFYETPLGQKGEVRQKHEAPENPTLSCFSKMGKPQIKKWHNHKVNENHKMKHDLLIVRFSVIDVYS